MDECWTISWLTRYNYSIILQEMGGALCPDVLSDAAGDA
jgi:hypothetical protein